jgi:hypothetical protein
MCRVPRVPSFPRASWSPTGVWVRGQSMTIMGRKAQKRGGSGKPLTYGGEGGCHTAATKPSPLLDAHDEHCV